MRADSEGNYLWTALQLLVTGPIALKQIRPLIRFGDWMKAGKKKMVQVRPQPRDLHAALFADFSA